MAPTDLTGLDLTSADCSACFEFDLVQVTPLRCSTEMASGPRAQGTCRRPARQRKQMAAVLRRQLEAAPYNPAGKLESCTPCPLCGQVVHAFGEERPDRVTCLFN